MAELPASILSESLAWKTLCDDEQRNESKFETDIALSLSFQVHTEPLAVEHSNSLLFVI